MQQKTDKIILGIDPGTNLMGYGVIRATGRIPGKAGSGDGRGRSGSGGTLPQFLDMGVVDLKKNSDPYMKLGLILEKTLDLIDRFLPDEVAIEAPFFGKNVQSMLKLGRAQGVAIAAVLSREIPVAEYAPRKIKLAITGAGNAGPYVPSG
jgi:crossover junction endodeoxyribonuclease RuvC